jgi:uncharacterized protein (DUF4415 family)
MGTVRINAKDIQKINNESWKAFDELKDDDIDTSDIPEVTDFTNFHSWKDRSLFRPLKVTITCKLDADIVQWLKKDGKGYQTRMNSILRKVMDQ